MRTQASAGSIPESVGIFIATTTSSSVAVLRVLPEMPMSKIHWICDFETVNPAIPRFSGMHPYDHVPFQWSVHVQSQPGATAKRFEFLAMDGGDPRAAFIASLCEALGERGTIVVYNQQFESQRLWELAGWLPEYTQRIRDIQRRLWDLLPVVRNHAYHPAFGGSFSLKAVCPMFRKGELQ